MGFQSQLYPACLTALSSRSSAYPCCYDSAVGTTGSGLGLAIAAAIVENHGGQIQVESIIHQGTTFIVTHL